MIRWKAFQDVLAYDTTLFFSLQQNPGGRGKKRITQFRNRYELSNGEIKIHSLTTEDGGTYVCKVGNKSELHFIQLIVSGNWALLYLITSHVTLRTKYFNLVVASLEEKPGARFPVSCSKIR